MIGERVGVDGPGMCCRPSGAWTGLGATWSTPVVEGLELDEHEGPFQGDLMPQDEPRSLMRSNDVCSFFHRRRTLIRGEGGVKRASPCVTEAKEAGEGAGVYTVVESAAK